MTRGAGPAAHILMDQCPTDRRARAEAIVRDALRGRDPGESWFVTLHRFPGGWDVFVEGPDRDLREVIAASLRTAGFGRR